ncbi:M20 metallopeptidase family protein [Clostridium vitabionis]|uniref:M20 metallopeptidase family protein n=1 Tax=Clostridium vitabionis TaxID=2784388 RepID=UPI00188A9AE6|nr:amidohydrolase [Clostridium vitabionis]
MRKENLKKITELRHNLHAHAELSLHENWTKQCLMDFLAENTSLEIVDRGNWFYALREGNGAGRRIAFRADMDALPIPETIALPYASCHAGVAHKCGHDGHSAALAGLALELDEAGRENLPAIFLIFQPGEEIGAGGEGCSRLLTEENIDEVYAFHNLSGYPAGSIVVRDGLSQPASKGLTIRFQGKTSHASYPEEGRNPAFAMAELVDFIRREGEGPHRGMVLCTIVGMNCGNGDFGISAGDGKLSLTLRAENEEEMDHLQAALEDKAGAVGRRDGLAVTFSQSDYFPETRNHPKCLKKVEAAAERLGRPVIHMEELWRASEDFGWYLKRCPGAIFYIGNGENYPALHTTDYDFNDGILETAVDMFWQLAISSGISQK